MFIEYVPKNFRKPSLDMIDKINLIIDEYQQQGYDLTLRQLYYQLVARDIIPNSQREYKRIGSIVNDGRLAGLISWTAIVDRTRELRSIPSWANPQSIIRGARRGYRLDLWQGQPYRVEVWIEKDALRGVIRQICDRLNVPDFSCRGFTSQSEMWEAGNRLREYADAGQTPVLVHLGDHDPSGIDMSRDIQARLEMFNDWREGGEFHFIRAALNMDQVQMYNPPPNFAKTTDSRSQGYIAEYGKSSWELDALSPSVLDNLITDIVENYRDDDIYEQVRQRQEQDRAVLKAVEENWAAIAKQFGVNGNG